MDEPLVRVHSRESVEVTCSRKAARSAGTLRHMMDGAPAPDSTRDSPAPPTTA